MMEYAVAIGSNKGDRAGTLTRAAGLVSADGRVAVLRVSPLLENPALGGPPGQQDFLNGAWIVATGLGPHQLLRRLQQVEDQLGRVRSVRDGPRTCDLDLVLAADGRCVSSSVLTLPHPRMCQREFVLQPLAAVAPDWRHPTTGHTIRQLWQRLQAEA